MSGRGRLVAGAMALLVVLSVDRFEPPAEAQQAAAPVFKGDPAWPTIPTNMAVGEVSSIAVDSRDHIWVLHRPRTVPEARRAMAAPPVLEFDSSGKLLASWGGDGQGFDWPEREHGIFADTRGFIWITGNGSWPKPNFAGGGDDMVLKFTREGKFVMQIGKRGQSRGNTDTANLHQPADIFVHAPTNELFVADGYGNQRVVVFDAATGAFKRMWGAYGNTPPAEMAPNPSAPIQDQVAAETNKQFGLVHAVKVSQDGVVYVADRTHNRVQTFTTEGKFLKQARISVDGGVTPVPAGFAFSGDKQQRYLYVVDSGLNRIIIFERATMTQVGTVGSRGPMHGQFDIVHHMASDSKGNLYAAEIVTNRRAQRLLLQSAR
jgi:DNA-binding beta-propeller fold protein YncE